MEFAATATHHLSGCMRHGFTYISPYRLTPVQPLTGPTTFLRHPIACLLPAEVLCSPIRSPEGNPSGFGQLVQLFQHGRGYTGTGISTRCPSTTPVGLALGPDLPWADQLDPGTLSQSAHTFLTCVSLLMPAFSLVNRPQLASAAASPGTRRSPTHPNRR